MESVSNTIYALYRGTPSHGEWIVACLQGAWDGVLGEHIAGTCRPVTLRGAELVVEVSEKAWFPVLSSMQRELSLRICRATGGEIRQLMFKLQPDK